MHARWYSSDRSRFSCLLFFCPLLYVWRQSSAVGSLELLKSRVQAFHRLPVTGLVLCRWAKGENSTRTNFLTRTFVRSIIEPLFTSLNLGRKKEDKNHSRVWGKESHANTQSHSEWSRGSHHTHHQSLIRLGQRESSAACLYSAAWCSPFVLCKFARSASLHSATTSFW